jgi:folate-binding Fe-S cluster repair protein YgfZ
MLGFERIGAVSFSKGCYPGQEVIARARYLGRVKRKPLRLVVDEADAMAGSVHGDLVPGAALSLRAGADRLEATLIDLVPLAHRNQILLFLVAPETGETVTAVTIGGRDYRCATI